MFFLAPYSAHGGKGRGDRTAGLKNRVGFGPRGVPARAATASRDGGAIWIHAVSVGEVLAAQPLLAGLKQEFPGRAVFVSTTTETGQRLARTRLQCADGIFYFPLDWVMPVRKALTSIQ